MRRLCFIAAFAMATTLTASIAAAQTAPAPQPAVTPASVAKPAVAPPTVTGGIKPPADYVIGIDDAFEVVYWQDKDMSATVVVRPDGYISLPLVNDIKAAGLTPEELRAEVARAATKFVADPTVSVVVKAINSRKVYITGQVGKPGTYSLMDSITVLQMLAMAGGPSEYAKTDNISIVRRENGKDTRYKFSYKKVSEGKSLEQNIVLKPGDTIIVP